MAIKQANLQNQKSFMFYGKMIDLNSEFAILATYNPFNNNIA